MDIKIVASNKKAYHDYFIDSTYETGIVLVGSEVKSIRLGGVNLKDSFCIIKNGEIFILNMHVSPYEKGSYFNEDPRRTRKLLMKRAEIDKLLGKVSAKGYTLVPTKIYFKGGLVKVEVGLARGKELHDKRDSIKEKDMKRDLQRQLKNYRK
ncbi:MAG: SsrA-binding protein SmpB [Clostridia bacterium]|jgi:SsrA-binding protein|nr:SsrA-binding protein SmpB [Clostridia bacterium]